MRKKRVLSLFFILLIGISALVPLYLRFQDKAIVAATGTITTTSYSDWTATTLSDAKTQVDNLLTSQKTNKNAQRPYLQNTTWTEGSLMALDKVYQASLDTGTGVSSDLIREQMIQTVQKLELLPNGNYGGSVLSLNNYPNDQMEYAMDYFMKGAAGTNYDIIFMIDWSYSMNKNTGTHANQSLHAKDMVLAMSRKILKSSDSRVRLISTNASINNDINGKGLNIQADSGFFSVKDDYERLLTTTYPDASYSYNGFTEDNMAFSIKYAKEEMEKDLRTNATPVIVLLSDFTLYYKNSSGQVDTKPIYINFLTQYYESSVLASKSTNKPIYLAAAYYYNFNNNFLGENETLLPGRKGWQVQYIPPTAPGYREAPANFEKMFDAAVSSDPWQTALTSSLFRNVTGSFSSSQDTVVSLTETNLSFKGGADSTGSYLMNVDTTKLGTYKKGDKQPAHNSAAISYSKGGTATFTPSPSLFLPITDAAVELYTYKGTGSKSDKNNYQLVETVVSNNYQNYGGTSYAKKSTQLSSLVYGTSMTKTTAQNVLQATLGATDYAKYKFNFAGDPTAASQTIGFDSGENVYQVYAEPTASKIVIEYLDKDTLQPIKANKEISGLQGTSYSVAPDVIANYTFDRSEGAALSGTYTATDQSIKLYYKAKETTITIEYLDKDTGKSIKANQVMTGKIGADYTITQDAIPNYTYDSASAALTGKYLATNQTIKLYYKAQKGLVYIQYLNVDTGQVIQANKSITGNIGSTYNITPDTLTNYSYVRSGGDSLTGQYAQMDKIVQLYYKVNTGTITIQYYDEDTLQPFQAPKTISGNAGSNYTVVPDTFNNYSYSRSSGVSLTGQYNSGNQDIRLYYKAIKKNVVVKYVDSDTGKPLKTDRVLNGQVGTDYEVSPDVITNYNYERSTGASLIGKYAATDQTITLYYKVKDAKVIIEYLDAETGKPFKPNLELPGKAGGDYTVTPDSLPGYTLDRTAGAPLTGKYTETDQVVQLYYKAKETNLVIKYVDSATGKTLQPDKTMTGKFGTDYTISPDVIDKYTFERSVGADLQGKYLDKDQVITLYYKESPIPDTKLIIEYIDKETGKPFKPNQEIPGKPGTDYQITPETILNYTFDRSSGAPLTGKYTDKDQIIQLYYAPKVSNIIVKFVDGNGKEIVASVTVADKKVGSIVDLSKETSVTSILNNLTSQGYEIIQRPVNETNLLVVETGNTVLYQLEGKLIFVSAPSLIDFGTQILTASKQRINQPQKIQGDLAVKDNRSSRKEWNMTAKLMSPLWNGKDIVMDSLRYVYKDKEAILNNGEQEVSRNTNTDNQLYKINNTWSEAGDGLKLQTEVGAVKSTGDYSAIVRWTLHEVPY